MQARLVLGCRSRCGDKAATACCAQKPELLRIVTTKASNRAAVHGHKQPPTEKIINDEEVEKEKEKGKEKIEQKREDIEKTLDSKLNHPDAILASLLGSPS